LIDLIVEASWSSTLQDTPGLDDTLNICDITVKIFLTIYD